MGGVRRSPPPWKEEGAAINEDRESRQLDVLSHPAVVVDIKQRAAAFHSRQEGNPSRVSIPASRSEQRVDVEEGDPSSDDGGDRRRGRSRSKKRAAAAAAAALAAASASGNSRSGLPWADLEGEHGENARSATPMADEDLEMPDLARSRGLERYKSKGKLGSSALMAEGDQEMPDLGSSLKEGRSKSKDPKVVGAGKLGSHSSRVEEDQEMTDLDRSSKKERSKRKGKSKSQKNPISSDRDRGFAADLGSSGGVAAHQSKSPSRVEGLPRSDPNVFKTKVAGALCPDC